MGTSDDPRSDREITGDAAASPAGESAPPAMARPPQRPRRRRLLRAFMWAGVGAVALFALIQAVPYGRGHTNPPVSKEPSWDRPQTRTLFLRACGDCHSNLTSWPWYSNIAPVSWLVQHDVDDGRAALNVSRWDRPQDGAGDVPEAINGGGMPPSYYTWIHSDASLTGAEKRALVGGWLATLRRSPAIAGGG